MVNKLLTTLFSIPTNSGGWKFDRTRATSLIVGVASAVFTACSTYTKNHLANRAMNFLIGVIPTLISLKIYLIAGRKLANSEKDLTGWEKVNAWWNPPSSPKPPATVVAPPASSAAAAAAPRRNRQQQPQRPTGIASSSRCSAPLESPAAAAAAPCDPVRLASLWQWLELKTQTQYKSADFVPIALYGSNIVWPHRYNDTHHPKASAIQVGDRYLHASRVRCDDDDIGCRFIVSEAPSPTTRAQFWQAFYETSITGIIDLTTDDELRRDITNKYYLETVDDTVEYSFAADLYQDEGNLSVKLCKIEGKQHYYSVSVKDCTTGCTTGVEKMITRLHCKEWVNSSGADLSTLKTLVDWLEQHSKQHSNAVVWIHCISGMGRSCALIIAYILKQKIARGHITEDNLDECALSTGVAVRQQRGPEAMRCKKELESVIQYCKDALSLC